MKNTKLTSKFFSISKKIINLVKNDEITKTVYFKKIGHENDRHKYQVFFKYTEALKHPFRQIKILFSFYSIPEIFRFLN